MCLEHNNEIRIHFNWHISRLCFALRICIWMISFSIVIVVSNSETDIHVQEMYVCFWIGFCHLRFVVDLFLSRIEYTIYIRKQSWQGSRQDLSDIWLSDRFYPLYFVIIQLVGIGHCASDISAMGIILHNRTENRDRSICSGALGIGSDIGLRWDIYWSVRSFN